MDTELSFLLTLLLEHELTQETKLLIKERLKLVESKLTQSTQPIRPLKGVQSPSTQAMIDRDGPLIVPMPEAVAQTPEAAQALIKRNEIIQRAVNQDPFGGKPEANRSSPRKF